jgi:hypothetical protein
MERSSSGAEEGHPSRLGRGRGRDKGRDDGRRRATGETIDRIRRKSLTPRQPYEDQPFFNQLS